MSEILSPRIFNVIPSTSDAGVVYAFIAPFDGEVVALRGSNGADLASDATKNISFTLKKIPVADTGAADTAVTVGVVGGVNKAFAANVSQAGALTAANVKFKKGDVFTVTSGLATYAITTPLLTVSFISGYSK